MKSRLVKFLSLPTALCIPALFICCSGGPREPQSYADLLAALNSSLPAEEQLKVVFNERGSLEGSPTVYFTNTGRSYLELSCLRRFSNGWEAAWRGTLLVQDLENFPAPPTEGDYLATKRFVIQGDPELLERLRWR
jgi:hypothetical protein